jgi:hypothetical protein
VRTYTHTHPHIHTYIHAHTYLHTYVHTHSYKHTYILTHVFTHSSSFCHAYLHIRRCTQPIGWVFAFVSLLDTVQTRTYIPVVMGNQPVSFASPFRCSAPFRRSYLHTHMRTYTYLHTQPIGCVFLFVRCSLSFRCAYLHTHPYTHTCTYIFAHTRVHSRSCARHLTDAYLHSSRHT